MTIVAGFDVHRAQITFDALDQETGELHRGRIAATPEAVRDWVGRFPEREVHVAVEACTGWLFVCQALEEKGAIAHLAEPTRPPPGAAPSAAPRPTAPTPATCGRCSRRAGCPSPGCLRRTCASGARARACERR
jgi:hypothetical protein